MLPHLERPSLRPGLAVGGNGHPSHLLLQDGFRLVEHSLRITAVELDALQRFQGRHTLAEIRAGLLADFPGQAWSLDALGRLAARLDEACFLEGPHFERRLNLPVRPPSCLGCYSADPSELDTQMRRLFTGGGGPGLPAPAPRDDTLVGAVVPHIDYARGGVTYGWGFKEIHEHTTADLFVIVATSHYSGHRFTLTRQDFQTPLGVVPADQAFIDRLVAEYGPGLFADRLAHAPEHSIELEVVLLHWLRRERPFRIVPLLVGSFGDCVQRGTEPARREDIRRLVAALRAAARGAGRVCYLVSGDLAHIGPKFGDARPVTPEQVEDCRVRDARLLERACARDGRGYFGEVRAEGDRRRICGFPPTAVFLEAADCARGRVLHYGLYRHPAGSECVSFASVGFYN